MPEFLIYGRLKNSKQAKLLFKGKKFVAVDANAAITKALHNDHSLRRSRLMAVKAPASIPLPKTNIEVEMDTRVEALTPEQMKAVLTKPIEEST